jgi:hypothetical protein
MTNRHSQLSLRQLLVLAERSPGQQVSSKDSVNELFNLLERNVEHKGNGIIIYVHNVD